MSDPDRLTERERLVLAWDKGPEEWEDEYGGQYGVELVDAERKRAELLRQGRYSEAREAGDPFVDGFTQAQDGP